MQILIFALILITLVAFIIYRVNNKFETKEIVILLTLVFISIAGIFYLIEKNETRVPQIFKAKYENTNKIDILKLSFERLNNKTLSSNVDFVYNFDYIINKNGIDYICSLKNIKIKKIEDEYIFENFQNVKEECNKK